MLALFSLVSLFAMPMYKIIKNIRQRGRLPDMKATRVYITLGVLAGLLAAIFLMPLPVSRIRDTGLVSVDPGSSEGVMLPEPARLTELEVKPGQQVRKGQVLGRFTSEPLNVEIVKATAEAASGWHGARQAEHAIEEAQKVNDDAGIQRYRVEAKTASERAEMAAQRKEMLIKRREAVKELVSPRDGTVLGAPAPDEIGKLFDRGYTETTPVFLVGDPRKLQIRVAVSPPDYRLLKDDLNEGKDLPVSVLIKGRSDREFVGRLSHVPAQNAETVPIQLTQRGGGPLAIKPGGDPNVLIPLAQVYLVDVEVTDPDAAIDPGQLAVVKIHTKWRSAGWWMGRSLANALDIGLY
jgi:putative peptide zinc metalloprotease protein